MVHHGAVRIEILGEKKSLSLALLGHLGAPLSPVLVELEGIPCVTYALTSAMTLANM